MKQEIYFPLRIESVNKYRGAHWGTVAKLDAPIKFTVSLVLTQLQRPPLVLNDGTNNVFKITLIRVANGSMDDGGNVASGGFKAVRDCVAEWIGIDDGDPNFICVCLQQRGPYGFYGVKIIVQDSSPGLDVEKHLKGVLPTISEAMERPNWGRHADKSKATPRPRAKARKADPNQEVIAVKCFAVLPWEQDDSDDAVLTELHPRLVPLCEAFTHAPPPFMRCSPDGREVVFVPSVASLPPPEGKCWVYKAR